MQGIKLFASIDPRNLFFEYEAVRACLILAVVNPALILAGHKL